MTDTTARLALPLLQPGQAQKEMWHNEALAALDLLVAPAVEEAARDAPPAAPEPGQCWLVGAAPTGDWQGRAGALAGWTAAGWRFADPRPGLRVWNKAEAVELRWTGDSWESGVLRGTTLVIGGEPVASGSVADPSGGTTVDAEARAALTALLDLLRRHGLVAR